MKVTYRLHELTTGKPVSIPVHAPGRWSDSLSQGGSGKHEVTIPIASRFTPSQWHAATMPWWHVLVECWDGVPAYAGIIIDKHWSPRRQVLSIDTRTVGTLLQDRYPFGVGSYLTTTFGVSGLSLRAVVLATVQRVFTDPTTPTYQSWAAPFDYPHLGEAGGFSKDYPNEDWRTADQIISFIQKLEGGPDLAFIPKYVENGWLRWDVLAGDPRIPGPTVDLPLSARASAASDLLMHEYGKDMISGLFVRGEGYDDRRPVGEAGNVPGPFMAVRDSASSQVAEDTGLSSQATASLAKNRSPIDQIEIGALRLGSGPGAVSPASARLGARLNGRYGGDGYREAFRTTLYLTSLSHSSDRPDYVSPEVVAI